MGYELKKYKFDELKANKRSAFAMGPFGSNIKVENFVKSGIPIIKGGNLNAIYLCEKFTDFLTEEKASELASSSAEMGDIVITHRGTLGQVGIIPINSRYKKYIVSQSQLKLSFNLELVDPYFIYYFLKSNIGQQRLLVNTSQVGVPAIAQALTSIRSIEIDLPALDIQIKIVHLIKLLDQKILLLNDSNKILETIAQTIFKSWFINFDPVYAKQQGKECEGIDAQTAALFPDAFEVSELGDIPKGWSIVSLKDVVSIYDTKRIPLSSLERQYIKGAYPYYGAASMMDRIDKYIFDGIYLLLGEDGTVVDDENHPVLQYVWDKFWVNNHAHVLQGDNGISTEHLMLFLQGVNMQPYITGAVQLKISQGSLWRIKFIKPPENVSKAFDLLIDPFFQKIRSNHDQIASLTNLRDTILPRLISGQLPIDNFEQLILEDC